MEQTKFHCSAFVSVRSRLASWWSCASCLQQMSLLMSWIHFYITAHFFSSGGAFPSAFSISKMIRLKTSTAVCISRILSSECESVSEMLSSNCTHELAFKRGIHHYLILLGWGLHECSTPGISKFLSLLCLDNPGEIVMQTPHIENWELLFYCTYTLTWNTLFKWVVTESLRETKTRLLYFQ